MSEIKIGLIPSPELPTVLAYDLAEELPTILSHAISGEIDWKVEIVIDPLIGAAENAKEMVDQCCNLKQRREWQYALSLTDLPLYVGKDVILADANFGQGVAQISVPAFGSIPVRGRVRKVIIQLMKELYNQGSENGTSRSANREAASTHEKYNFNHRKKGLIRRQFPFSSIRRIRPSNAGEGLNLRFIIRPRINGKLRMLLGMTYANRPWTILPSFKPIVAVAFATGAYGLIFPTLWKISASFEIPRLIGLMLAAMFSIIVWIIVSHGLWEKPTKKGNRGVRNLYNEATVLTLIVAVIVYYVALFVLFMLTVMLFVSPQLFGSMTGLGSAIDFGNYVKLAWLATSIATLAGSIGAGLENDELVQNVTYGYRQKLRYKKVQENHDKNK